MSTTISIIGIFLGLAVIMFLVWKGYGIAAASLCAATVVVFTSGLNWVEAMTSAWLPGVGNFVTTNFLLFALSALFGRLMEKSGAAGAIADVFYGLLGGHYCIYGAMLAAAIMTYGGVSGFVAVFTIYPIFLSCCRKANLPRNVLPGMMYGSIATWAGVTIPGSVCIQNLLPMPYLGTTNSPAPFVSTVSGLVCAVLIFLYWEYVGRKCRRDNKGFDSTPEIDAIIAAYEERPKSKYPILGFLPLVALLVLINFFHLNALIGLLGGCAVCMLQYWNAIDNKKENIVEGLGGAVTALINTGVAIAFASVVQVTGGYEILRDALTSLAPSIPLLSLGLATTILCGICGSGFAGMTFSLQTLAPSYLAMGLNPEIIHRVITIAGTGLDSLPHCGMVTTFITYCGMTHKESYKHIFVVSVLCTMVMLMVCIVLGSIVYPVG